MRAVIQRVGHAAVAVDGRTVGEIPGGLLVFLGVADGDEESDLEWLVGKVARLRIFPDGEGKMNRSLADEAECSALVISQFTLFGNVRKGTRPSFNRAAPVALATRLYERFKDRLAGELGRPVAAGIFAADMRIEAVNDGPVTIILDTRDRDF